MKYLSYDIFNMNQLSDYIYINRGNFARKNIEFSKLLIWKIPNVWETGKNDVSNNLTSFWEMKHFVFFVIAWLRAHGLFSLYLALRMFVDGSKTKKSAKSS